MLKTESETLEGAQLETIENLKWKLTNNLTEAVYELGSFEVVEKYFKEYIALHPANLNMLFSLAGIQFKLEKIVEAKDNLENILVFAPPVMTQFS